MSDAATDRRGAIAGAAALGLGGMAAAAFGQTGGSPGEPGELVVVWTSGDPDVAHRVGLMYTHAAKKYGWFETVRLIVWGPSQRTLAGDKDLIAKAHEMRDDGVELLACVACAKTFGLVDRLTELDFRVAPMGLPLSKALKDPGVCVLTV